MTTRALFIKATSARKQFKKNAGQNNHFLITLLIGVDAVRSGHAKRGEEFSTSWAPHDVARSADRSREYALVTSIAWITDLVDVYRSSTIKLPGLFMQPEIAAINNLDGRALKLAALAKHLDLNDIPEHHLTAFAIAWRNRFIHSDSSNRLNSQLKARLTTFASFYSETHRGLDILESIERFNENLTPRFKEVASMIAAAQSLVRQLDAEAVKRIDLATASESIIAEHLTKITANSETALPKRDSNAVTKIWPGSPSKSSDRITQILIQSGFSRGEAENAGGNSLDPHYFEALTQLTAAEARKRFLLAGADSSSD
ncbi:hypothetical protein [Plantibacter sp. YIM 135347]|uniref:hypothetical protein n=1 Tax=Plantibacter sp. YIM 135347 TaxID=3423919 RepID=UPI003D33AC87